MAARFHPQLVHEPFGDPGLYVDLLYERRAVMFDLGDLNHWPTRKLLKVSDVFVSHMHMDHLIGFDRLLRLLLGRERVLRLYGPEGLIASIGHKLAAYTWNLVHGYSEHFVLTVTELHARDRLKHATFRCRHAFKLEDEFESETRDGVLLDEESVQVRAAILDHSIPCLGFALAEPEHVNIWKNRLKELGLGVGPWLTELKELVHAGAPDDREITACWRAKGEVQNRTLRLGDLRDRVVSLTPGAKVGYVVDVGYTEANAEKIVTLVDRASTLFIETPFLDADADLARDRNHLTAAQAGRLAARAGVEKLVPFHFSPRYEDRPQALNQEAQATFRGLAAGVA